MKIISRSNPDLCLVEISNGKATFPKKISGKPTFFETIMQKRGVEIPAGRVEDFGNKHFIKADNPLFPKAIEEIYCNPMLDKDRYEVVD